ADDRGHRPENLLAIDAHVVRGLGEQRRLQIEARRLAVETFAAIDEVGAFLAADLEIFLVLFELLLVDYGADMGALLERVVDDEALHLFDHGVDETVVDSFGHDKAGGGGASLAGGEERAVDGGVDGGL